MDRNRLKLAVKMAIGFAIPMLIIIVMILFTYLRAGSLEKDVMKAQRESTQSFQYAMLANKMQLEVVQVQQFLSDVSATRAQNDEK